VIILPSAFTLGNLFFGMWAIVAASQGDFMNAGWFIIVAGVLDMLDGRIARFTRTGSDFGAELDSLVDAISFGVAPAVVMHQLLFSEGDWSWTVAFVYTTAAVVRLARFNIEQAGHAKSHFNGLPSPSAGMLLASYYPFSQTYFFETWLADLAWPRIMGVTMVLLGVLMVSHVPYPVVPKIGLATWRKRFNLVFLFGCTLAAIVVPRYYFFTALVLYTTWGLVKSVLLGLLERLPERDPLLDDDDEDGLDDSGAEVRALDYTQIASMGSRGGRTRRAPSPEEDR
jgi:CDP-diacylglycerol--serine O-phosphatidyltransferase